MAEPPALMTGLVARKTLSVVPWWSAAVELARSMVPPCLVMMPRLIQRPRPVPRSPLVVKKGWKRLARMCSGTPGPLSSMVMRTPASRRMPSAWVAAGLASAASLMVPPGPGGFGGVGEQVGEDLAQLGREAVDAEISGNVVRDVDPEGLEAAFHEQQDGVEHLAQVNEHGGF